MSIDFEGMAEQPPAQENNKGELAQLVARMRSEEAEVERLEQLLKQAKATLRTTVEKNIPELMQAMGFTSLGLEDGSTVVVKADLSCSISEARRPAVVAWLNKNGHGDLVETTLAIAYGPGKEQDATTLALRLHEEQGLVPVVNTGVNTSRFKALVRELLSQGKDVPLEELGVYQFKQATVKAPK